MVPCTRANYPACSQFGFHGDEDEDAEKEAAAAAAALAATGNDVDAAARRSRMEQRIAEYKAKLAADEQATPTGSDANDAVHAPDSASSTSKASGSVRKRSAPAAAAGQASAATAGMTG